MESASLTSSGVQHLMHLRNTVMPFHLAPGLNAELCQMRRIALSWAMQQIVGWRDVVSLRLSVQNGVLVRSRKYTLAMFVWSIAEWSE
jgi:hypothetical protein